MFFMEKIHISIKLLYLYIGKPPELIKISGIPLTFFDFDDYFAVPERNVRVHVRCTPRMHCTHRTYCTVVEHYGTVMESINTLIFRVMNSKHC